MHASIRKTFFLFLLTFVGCASTTNLNTLHGSKKQVLFYPKEEFQKQSDALYIKTISSNKEIKSPQVDRVITQLIKNTSYFRADTKDWKWEYHVLKSQDRNAFCAAGGKMAIYTGLLDLKLTDDEVAVVMAHEIAHALREHSRAEASRMVIEKVTMGILAQGLNGNAQQVMSIVDQLGVNLPNSRSKETEADLIGVELMAKSGYDPKAAISFWKKMINAENENKGLQISLLRTHPVSKKRIDDIQKNMPYFLKIYSENH